MKEGKPRSRSDYDPAAVAAAEPAVQLCMWTQQQPTVLSTDTTTTPSLIRNSVGCFLAMCVKTAMHDNLVPNLKLSEVLTHQNGPIGILLF